MIRKGVKTKTTPSQEMMLEHLAYLVIDENRPASWRDFQYFMVDGKEYSLKRGTIRNNLSQLRRLGLIELSYRSIGAYYTLPGYDTHGKVKAMTANHARVYKRDLSALIEMMAFDTPAAHDIRLRFNSHMIWYTLSVLASPSPFTKSTTRAAAVSHVTSDSASATLSTRPVSKDLMLPVMTLDSGIKGIVTVHKNDTVSVILSCSESPIKFDIGGLLRLSSSLARIEESLSMLIDMAQRQTLLPSPLSSSSAPNPAATTTVPPVAQVERNCSSNKKKMLLVPEYWSWTVTMWHIGRDSIERYAGEKFEVAWENFTGEWDRVYSKEMNDKPGIDNGKARKKCIVRIERQEYPKETLRTQVKQKLSSISTTRMFFPDTE